MCYVLINTRLKNGFENWIGWRYLMARRRQGLISSTAFISILGVMLGVASLIAVTGLMSGYQRDVTERILNSNAHLIVQKYGTDFREYEDILKKCRTVPGVISGSPFVFNEAMVSTDGHMQGVMLKGVDPARISQITNVANQLQNGATLDMLYPKERGGPNILPGIFVGSEFLQDMNVSVGDVVALTTPVGISKVKGNTPKRMQFVIAGVFKSGVFEFDQKLIYADITAAQQFMGLDGTVTGLELKVKDAERVQEVAAKVINRLSGYPFRTLDWREMNAGIFMALKIQKLVMFLVLIFIIIVAAFNIASTLFMVVVEKSDEIALMKALGVSDASVMKIFMVVGWIIGLTGTLLGVVLGIAIAYILSGAHFQLSAQVYLVDNLSVLLNPLEITVTALAALIICHLATVFPSLQAAAVRPAVNLRSE
jgi:lipoprotein-releasing system permease protein